VLYDFSKRCLDVVGSVAGLLLSAPIFILASFLISLDRGPVFFRQERVGHNGKMFRMLKFRTMIPDAGRMENSLRKLHAANGGYGVVGKYHDPRITRIGSILRRTNLDELPQLLNVLKGEMSLVGPRPVPYEESLFYSDKRDNVLSVRPGLTGYWQIKRRMTTDYSERIALDCYYVKNRNLLLDTRILFTTPIAMLTSDYNSLTKPLPPLDTDIFISEVASIDTQSSQRIEHLEEEVQAVSI